MKVYFADLYGAILLLGVFFVIYITTGGHHQRILQTSSLSSSEEFQIMLRKHVSKDHPTYQNHGIFGDDLNRVLKEHIPSRKSRLTKSMVARKHMITTTERSFHRNESKGSLHNLKKIDALIADIYNLRKSHLQQACESQGKPQLDAFKPDKIQKTILVEKKHAILFCNIPKVSSSFWKRTLTVLETGGRYRSPYDVSLAQTSLPNFLTLKNALPSKQMELFLRNASSFIFVRDPYARLFSGYVNKIYCPNKHYWKTMGTRIAKATRRFPSEMSLKYGHDISFSEFVKFVLKFIDRGYKLDQHFAPMSSKCDPCKMPYNFIGKLETFHRDAQYLLDSWRHKFNDFNISFNDFETDSIIDTADLHIRLMYQTWDFIRESGYPLHYMALRVWSDLQIRGYVSKSLPFPFNPSDSVYITRETFLKAIKEALLKPADIERVKRQRDEALIQAYRTVSLRDMEKLRKFLLKDCMMFGYDDRPAKLFDRSKPFKVDHQYLVGL